MSTDLKKKFLEGVAPSTSQSYFIPQIGQNLIKIVVKGSPVATISDHFIKWSAACLKQKCPICYLSQKYGIEEWRARELKMVWVADLNDPSPLLKLFTFGSMIASKLHLLASNYDILDPKKGHAILLQRMGQGKTTKYELVPKEAVDLTQLDQYQAEYETLPLLEEVVENRLQETKRTFLKNMEAYLPPELFREMVKDLATKGYLEDYHLEEYEFILSDAPTPTISPKTATIAAAKPKIVAKEEEVEAEEEEEETESIQDIIKKLKKQ